MDRILSDHRCECGCGEFTYVSRWTKNYAGHVKGQPYRFRPGHQRRLLPAKDYPVVSDHGRSKQWHLYRAERAFGGRLPAGAEVHHADLTKSKSSPLVICQNTAYHHLLHIRTRVLRAGGDPNTQRLCKTCGAVKAFAEMVKSTAPCEYMTICKACVNVRQNEARRRRKARAA